MVTLMSNSHGVTAGKMNLRFRDNALLELPDRSKFCQFCKSDIFSLGKILSSLPDWSKFVQLFTSVIATSLRQIRTVKQRRKFFKLILIKKSTIS